MRFGTRKKCNNSGVLIIENHGELFRKIYCNFLQISGAEIRCVNMCWGVESNEFFEIYVLR